MRKWLQLNAILLVVVVVALEALGKKKKIPPPPAGLTYWSRAYCLHEIHDFGWFTCVEDACRVNGHLPLWTVYKSLKDQCTKLCQRSSFGVACELGDVYIRSRSGIQVGMDCQCNGRSDDKYCVLQNRKVSDMWTSLNKVPLADVRTRCTNWCMDHNGGQKNAQHCSHSGLAYQNILVPTLTTSPPTKPKKNKTKKKKKKKSKNPPGPLASIPLTNLTCACLSSGTAADEGEDILEPV